MPTAYLALDVHARRSVLGHMNSDGKYLGSIRFPTSEAELIPRVANIEAGSKKLAVEEGPLAQWVARTLRPYVDEIFICDPRNNDSIHLSINKSDEADVYKLCHLLRLGGLKRVYHPEEDHRAVFKAAALHYLDRRAQQVALKQKIKAHFRSWGVLSLGGKRVYHPEYRHDYLARLDQGAIRRQLENLYAVHDVAVDAQKHAEIELYRLGRRYAEIKEFQHMPGIGPIRSHLFDAYIQTPHRFATKQKVWRYCCLGIRKQTSDGKPLAYPKLDRSGNSELKSISNGAFRVAVHQCDENAVSTYYEQSLARTHDPTHARLNTQRKILATLWSIWKNDTTYKPERFLGSESAPAT